MFGDDKPRGWCRRCGYTAFADDDKKDFVISPELRQKWLEERIAKAEEARRTAETAIALLRQEEAWLRWHTNMTERGYEFWHGKGVSDWAINYYQLGYCPSKTIRHAGEFYTTPTATIPVFGVEWTLVNLRHRLINPPDPGDKYRPDRAGLPAAMYLTDPDKRPSGETILVEGEVKAIVLRTRLDNAKLAIVGIPGKNPSTELLEQLSDCYPIHVILDPDAEAQARGIAVALGPNRARIVTLPTKPDDFFVLHDGTERNFMSAIRQGKRL